MSEMYFGTAERMTWVPCPNTGMARNRVGWTTNGTYLNGGGYSRSSSSNHFEPTLTWSFLRQSQVSELMAYYHRAYGDGPIYWLDPFAMQTNVLPPYLSVPSLAFDDAPPWVKNRRPTLSATTSNTLSLPTQTAVYTLASGDEFMSYFIPVPTGYTLHFGAYGTSTGTAELDLNGSTVTLLSTTDNSRVNTTTTSDVTITVSGVGTLSLTALTALVLPTGQTPDSGSFLIGEGHSGCRFKDAPTVVGYSAPDALDYQSVTANMIEVGSWE